MNRDFGDLLAYRVGMIGKCVVEVQFDLACDEGLVITFDDGSFLSIGFSGCEGRISFCTRKDPIKLKE